MRSSPSAKELHNAVVIVLLLYISGLVFGELTNEAEIAPRGMVSITRSIVPTEDSLLNKTNNKCNFAGNVVLGGFFSLESDDKFFTIGSHQFTAYNLMLDQINRYQCGVTLTEFGPENTLVKRNYALELRSYDDQSTTDGSTAIGKMLAQDPSVDIMVGGYSSTLTQPFVEIAQNYSEKLVLAAGAASTKAFVDKDMAFGLLPPSNKYLSQAIEALAERHGAKTIATVWEDSSFTRAACTSAPDLVEMYGMTITSATEVLKTPNATVLEPIAESLKGQDPDVVITCVYDCAPWIQAMRRVNWSPKAQVFTICVGQEKFSSQVGKDTAYIMGVTPWDSSLQIEDEVTGLSARDFAMLFRRASNVEEASDVPYQAAMAASLISMVYQAIQAVDGFRQNGPQLADYISKNTFQTMGGNLAFDENGQLKAPSLMIQYDRDRVVQTVYPYDAASAPILYPMPTWDHRDCLLISGCEGGSNSTDSFSGTGNVCDARGMCVCGDPLNYIPIGLGSTADCVHSEIMHYIEPSLKVISWVLCGLLFSFCFYALGWTYYYRDNPLVKVSQPFFLALLIVGSIISLLSMITMGIEGSYREDTENIWLVDTACMANAWLWGMGFAITYSALFAKVWRVHKLYKLASKMRRQTVDYKDVFFIIIIVVTAELIVLITFQVMSPQVWQRDVIEDVNGYSIESIGMCDSENSTSFLYSLMVLNVVFLLIALVLCWRTKDIPSDFSESNYIFLSVMFMFQILLLSVPVTAMVRNDANVHYFTRAGSVFLQNLSVLMLIFLPKMRRIYMGEDTDSSIRHALASDTFKEGRSNYIRARASQFYTDSQHSRTGGIDGSQDFIFRSQDTYFKFSQGSNFISEDSDCESLDESQDSDHVSSEESLNRSDEMTVERVSKLDYYRVSNFPSDETPNQLAGSKAEERIDLNGTKHDEDSDDQRNDDEKIDLSDEEEKKLRSD